MTINSLLEVLKLNFLYAEKFYFPKNWNYYESTIPYSMIRFIEKGSANFVIDDTNYVLEANDIIYIPQGSMLQCEALKDDFTFISIRFTAAFPSSDNDMWSKIMGYDMKIKCDDDQIKHFFNCIIKEKDASGNGKTLILRGYLELILGYLMNSSESSIDRTSKPRSIKTDNKNDKRIQIVLDYMVDNYATNMNIEEMSKMVNISSTTFRRLFRQHTGKSPSEFLIELKMAVSAKKILETDDRISDIAYLVGIDDPNYFSRVFKKHFGVTPYAYRKLAKD
ncbi:MAG: AraC family transcriptional regulator [Candidatus Pristimantibacillus sp.]